MTRQVPAIVRLAQLVPEPMLEAILGKLAGRLEELAGTKQGAELELRLRVVRGCVFEARWNGDERIGHTRTVDHGDR